MKGFQTNEPSKNTVVCSLLNATQAYKFPQLQYGMFSRFQDTL